MMKPTIVIATVLLAACAAGREGTRAPDPAGDARLAEAMAGRTAGDPQGCIRRQDIRGTSGGGNNVVLFEGPGDIVYVNRARGLCPRIETWHAVSHRTTSANLCEGELIRVFNPQSGIEYGGCTLGTFVPWRRAR
jgi:hypothetical protein